MKKFLLLTGMILAMGAFQSLKAQTFSRVVTVNRNLNQTQLSQKNGQLDTLFIVPNGKILKIEFFVASFRYSGVGNPFIVPASVFINGSLIPEFEKSTVDYNFQTADISKFKLSTSIWLKSNDVVSYQILNLVDCNVFFSAIEYDVP